MQRALEFRKFLLDNGISYQEVNLTHFEIYDPNHELISEVWPLSECGSWKVGKDSDNLSIEEIKAAIIKLYSHFTTGKNTLRKEFEEYQKQIQAARKLITVTELPSGALETQINDSALVQKYQYILDAYDDEMKLKSNPEIRILDFIIV